MEQTTQTFKRFTSYQEARLAINNVKSIADAVDYSERLAVSLEVGSLSSDDVDYLNRLAELSLPA